MDKRILELKKLYKKQIKEIDDCIYIPERWSLFYQGHTKTTLKRKCLNELINCLYKLV